MKNFFKNQSENGKSFFSETALFSSYIYLALQVVMLAMILINQALLLPVALLSVSMIFLVFAIAISFTILISWKKQPTIKPMFKFGIFLLFYFVSGVIFSFLLIEKTFASYEIIHHICYAGVVYFALCYALCLISFIINNCRKSECEIQKATETNIQPVLNQNTEKEIWEKEDWGKVFRQMRDTQRDEKRVIEKKIIVKPTSQKTKTINPDENLTESLKPQQEESDIFDQEYFNKIMSEDSKLDLNHTNNDNASEKIPTQDFEIAQDEHQDQKLVNMQVEHQDQKLEDIQDEQSDQEEDVFDFGTALNSSPKINETEQSEVLQSDVDDESTTDNNIDEQTLDENDDDDIDDAPLSLEALEEYKQKNILTPEEYNALKDFITKK